MVKSLRRDEADWGEIQLHPEQCTLFSLGYYLNYSLMLQDTEKPTFTTLEVKRIQILLPSRIKAGCI